MAGSMAGFLVPQNSFVWEFEKMRLTPPKEKTDMSGFFSTWAHVALLAPRSRMEAMRIPADGCGGR